MIQLTIENCKQYLESMSFESILHDGNIDDLLYFTAVDEDGELKEIEFEPLEDGRICVSVEEDGTWNILEILED